MMYQPGRFLIFIEKFLYDIGVSVWKPQNRSYFLEK